MTYNITRYFDTYPISCIKKCKTIEEARNLKKELKDNEKRPYTTYEILVEGDTKFNGQKYRTE